MSPVLRHACGIALIGVGIVAMPLPILPGIPIILAGVALLGRDHPLVTRSVSWLPDTWQQKLQGKRT